MSIKNRGWGCLNKKSIKHDEIYLQNNLELLHFCIPLGLGLGLQLALKAVFLIETLASLQLETRTITLTLALTRIDLDCLGLTRLGPNPKGRVRKCNSANNPTKM